MAHRSDDILGLEGFAVVKRHALAKLHRPRFGPFGQLEQLRQISADVALLIDLSQEAPNRQGDRKHVVVDEVEISELVVEPQLMATRRRPPFLGVAARTNALISGDIDYMDRCEAKSLKYLERQSGVEIDKTTGYEHNVFSMNVTAPPYDNKDVRNAIKFAVDREAILKKIYGGIGKVGNDNPVAANVKFAINPEPIHKYDPEMAKSLLKKAQVSNSENCRSFERPPKVLSLSDATSITPSEIASINRRVLSTISSSMKGTPVRLATTRHSS